MGNALNSKRVEKKEKGISYKKIFSAGRMKSGSF